MYRGAFFLAYGETSGLGATAVFELVVFELVVPATGETTGESLITAAEPLAVAVTAAKLASVATAVARTITRFV